MSGGYWNYCDQSENISLEKLPNIIEQLRRCFHEIDWAESSDSSREQAARAIYNIIKDLGDSLFEAYGKNSDKVPTFSELYHDYLETYPGTRYSEWYWRDMTREEMLDSWHTKKYNKP